MEASDNQRRMALAERIAYLSVRRWRVESETDYRAVLVKGRRPNHLLHLVLTVITLGFWAPVWLCLALFGGEKRRVLSVDPAGQIRLL